MRIVLNFAVCPIVAVASIMAVLSRFEWSNWLVLTVVLRNLPLHRGWGVGGWGGGRLFLESEGQQSR
jgi:hypothetical protein